MRNVLLITLFSITLTLGACGKKETVKEPPAEAGAEAPTDLESSQIPGGAPGDAQAEALRAKLAQRIIYFDFDNAEIRPEFRDVITAHAQNLARNPTTMKVRLEGHTDERGSREYNIGLGERRAQSVRRALMLQGVGDAQLVTVSYGEERPAVPGSDEAAWAKNRRVELVYGK
jgi:peptidoglycan-associated lipoprotein